MNIKDRFDLSGKTAILTGASKGIGLAMAAGLAEFGANVVISSRKPEAVEQVASDFKERGLNAIGIAAHAGKEEDLQNLVTQTMDTYGSIDIVVNNAATNPVFGPIQQTESAAFDKIMEVNLKGPFQLCKLVYPIMKKQGKGSVINVSSVEGQSPERYMGIYSVSKAALLSLTKVLAKEWGQDGIRVNAICPGLIKTKFSEALWKNESILNNFVGGLAINRIGEIEELGGLAAFLASDASSYCTGSIFNADGGYTI